MTDRYSRKDAEKAFDRLAYALGKQHTRWEQRDGKNVVNVGSWHLDCAPIYGGYVINEISNEGGGVTQPFGALRHPAREFCAMVNFALAAVEMSGAIRESDEPVSKRLDFAKSSDDPRQPKIFRGDTRMVGDQEDGDGDGDEEIGRGTETERDDEMKESRDFAAKLGKRYTNCVGNVFQRVLVTHPDGVVTEEDIKVRAGRDGRILYTNPECKDIAISRASSWALAGGSR